MGDHGVTLDKAFFLAVLMEAILYGFSLLMFGLTIAVLYNRWSSDSINRRMLVVACLLLLFSTAHLVIDIIRAMEGLILFRDTYPGGPTAFFGNVSQWTSVAKNSVYAVQTLLGDGVVLYRCYMVWQSKFVMIVPAILWCSVLVTGIGTPYTASRSQAGPFTGSISRWITSFYLSTLVTNLLTTVLLAYRIWSVDRASVEPASRQRSQLQHIIHIIIDAGAIYSVALFATLICFLKDSYGQYIALAMTTPVISITFYMVIIRVGLASNQETRTTMFPLDWVVANNTIVGHSTDTRNRTQVSVATLTEKQD